MRIFTLLVTLLLAQTASGQASAMLMAFAAAPAEAASDWLPQVPDMAINSPVCFGEDLRVTFAGQRPTETLTYLWTGPRGFRVASAEWVQRSVDFNAGGRYKFTVTDEDGRSAFRYYDVTVTPPPIITVEPVPAITCLGQNITLRASGGENYVWSGPRLTKAGGDTVLFNHYLPGDYRITVTGKEVGGVCTASETIIVTVQPAPKVSAGQDYTACAGLETQLVGTPGASEAGGVGVWSGSYVTPAGYFKADVPGSYSVRYTYTNEYGCKASDDALICVGGPPVASFTLPVNSVCTKDGREDLIRPVNTTPEGGCKPISYEWSVEYDGGECNSGSGKVFFEEGTTKNSRNPVMNPNKTGRYYLTLVALSECGSSTFLDTFSVFSKPLPEIVMSEDLFCDPRFINLGYDSPVCHAGGDFTLWRFPTASPPVVFEGSDPPPVYYEAGKHTVYVMSDNVCGTGNDTLTFTVMDHPDADFQFPSDTVCIGDTIQPIDNSGGTHLEYLWESPDTLISFSDSSQAVPDIAFGNLAQGWYSLTVTLSNLACPPSRQVIDVYVELPPQVTLAPIPEFCETASFTPTATYGIPLGSIDSFLWELSDGTTTTVLSTDPQVGPLSITTPGRYTLKVSATNRCKTVSSSRSFRIARTPEADFGASADVVCTTGANTITLTDRSGGDVDNYNWTVTNAGGATVFTATDASPTFTFTPAQQPGFYTIRADISNTACPMVSSWDTLIQVKENPTPTIDPIADGCTELRFTPTADYGPYAADIDSVRWTFPAGSSVLTSDQPAPGEVYLDRTGRNFPVILTVYNYCDSVSDTTYFDILEPPVAGFSLDTFVCIGDNLSPVNTTTGDDLTYRWSILPDSAASFSDSTAFEPVITFAGPRGSYPVRLITGNTTCGYDTIIRTVEVGAPPRIAIANIPDGCEEAFVVPSVSYGLPASEIDSVHWRLERLDNGPAVLYSGAPTGGTFHADRTGSYRLTVTAFNFCAPDGVTAREDFRVYERPEPALDLSTNLVCKGGSVTVTNVSGGDITQTVFTLYNPAGTVVATSSGSPATFTLDPVAPLGYYTIAMETGNPGCGTFRRDTTVTVSISPLLEIDPVADQCGTSEVTLSARLLGIMDAGNVISWQLWDESGALVMETGLLDDVTTTLPPGTYHSNANVMNRCGDDRGRDTFTIYQPPVADFDLNTLDVCRSASLQLTNTSSGDFDAVNWTVTDGSGTEVFTSTDADPTFSFDPAQPTGPYTVHLEVSNPLCSPSTKDTLIQLSAPPSIVLDSQPDVCEGTALTLSAVLSNTADIDSIGWRITNASGATVFFDQTFSPASVSLPAGSYDVEATVANACGTVTSRDQFRIYERPVADFTLDETRVCTEGSITATNTSTGDVTGLTFELLDQAGTVLSSSTGSPATFSFGGITDRGDYTVRLTVSNPFCGSFTRERTVRLYTPPTIVLNPQPDDCDRTTVLLSATTSDRTYIDSIGWRITDASGTVIYQDNNFNPAPVSLTTGLYAVEATVKNVCGYASSLDTFQVFETVRPRLVIDTNFICPGGTLTAIDSSAGDVTIRNFEVIDPSGATVATQTTSPAVFSFPTGSTPGDYILRMTVGNPSCGTLVRQTGFRVSESPTIVLDAQPDDCATTTVTLSATTSDPAFLDSIGWRITDASGTVVYSQASYNPVPVSLTPGVYAVEATVVNACGTETSRDTFQLYEAPEADFTVDTDFVCIGDNLTAVNNSRGDVTDLQFLLLDSAGTTVASAISSPATFTFPAGMQPGDYTLRLETGNPACGYTAKDTTIRLNAAPSITLDPQPDACDAASITLSATTSDQAFIDSIGWRITDASGGVVYVSNSFRPASITLNPGLYAVEAGVKNGCGEAVSRDTFQVYESPVANFTVNRDFVCRSGFVVARNTSTGDADNFTFTLINGLGSVIASSSNSPVSFNLNRTLSPGDYTLRLTVRNALCGTSTRDTIIRLTAPPTIDLNPTADACDNATVSLTGSTSNPTFIDSIGWRITDLNGAVVYTDNTFSPAPVTLPTGTYAVEATVTNDCGSDTKRDTFQIFSTPEPAFTLDATTVCEGSSITATNTSTGDVTDFTFEVLNQGGTVIFASSASPATFTFDGSQPIGDYVLRLTAGNPECGTVSRDTTIRLSAEPTIVLTPQDDDCDATAITLSGSTSDVAFIDSIGWRITDSSGTVVFTDNSFNPASINLQPGLYFVDATVANACGSDTSRDTFRLYEVSEPAFVLNTDFVCQGGTVTATNTSMGDVTDFTFEVLNQGGTVLFASTASPATFTFDGSQPIGDYVLRLTAGNPECVTVSRDTTIRLSAEPTIVLTPQDDDCDATTITLSGSTSDVAFIDSIGWRITDSSGTVVFTDNSFNPASINLQPGLYFVDATVANACGSDTSRDTFRLYEVSEPAFVLDTDFVCQGGTVTATNTSGGDVTDFTFEVLNQGGTVLFASSASPATFTFDGSQPIGDYVLRLTAGNPECGTVSRDTTIRLSAEPTIVLTPQDDDCDATTITLSGGTSDVAFIDSIGWRITDSSGTVVFTDNSFNPASINLPPGLYFVDATVANACGSDTSRDTFRLYEVSEPAFVLDTDFTCQGGTVTATNTSMGDVTDFTFEVLNQGGTVLFASTASPATFTFDGSQPIGDYVLRLTAGNPECVTVSRDTTIRLSAPPTVLLDPKQIDYCESAVITLSAITSDTAFIDSIGWQITDASGTVVFTDRGFYPAPVMLTPGLYAAEATVLNGCGSDTSRDTFQIFATPQPSFALAGDLVCADRTLTASITATGDVTDFTFSVLDTAGTVLMTSQDSLARFSFAGALPDGDYYLQLEVSNPQCGPFFRDTLVRLVSPPTIILDNQADACGETDITLSAATSDTAFIDSIGWQITDTSGTVVYTDNSFNPGPVSLLPGTYAVEATVRNGCGSDTSRDTFRLYKRPVPDFTLDTDLVCGNGTLTATSSSTGDVTDFTFEVIDPAGTAVYSSSASPATFAFDGSLAYGEYLVRLTVTNPVCGSLAKDTAITFTAAPDLVLNAQPDACGPIAVQLTASITNGDQADSVGWRITDAGGTVLLSDASLTPPAVDLDPGTYFVEATIANACTTVTDRDTFRIYEAPRADFDLTADLLCGSRDFTAANTSTGDITSFTFDVLDASGTVILSSTDSVAAFTFPLGQPDGAYTLRLTAGNPSCGSVSRDTMIRLTAPPAIVLDAQPDYCDPTRVQLTATSTDTAFIDSIGWRITTPDGKEVFSHYDFNPGSVDLAAGLYLVEATVKNDCGTDTSRDTFRIFALPQPAFTLDTDVVCRAGSFTVSNSSTGDVSDLTFEVLDPAGATVFSSNASPATFRFTDSHPLGDYTLRMTVGNDACGTAVRDTLIRLDATPAIVLDAQPDYCDTAAVQLTATLTDTTFADSIRWTITEQSGGVVYTDRTYTPAPANLSPGTYAVAAEIFGACGPGISRDTFRIYERPEPAFALNGDLLCQDRTLTVTHTSTGDVTDFSFSVLDAGGNTVYTSDQSPARFAFADALVDGDYTLRLEVSNPQCGTLTRDTTVRLQAPPTVILDPQTDYCDAATVALSASTSDPAFIDSIGWRITDTTGAAVYTDGSFAPATVDLGPGTYAVEVTVANACGSDVSRDTFRILSAPVVQLALAGDSLCRTTTVLTGVVNTSTGDDLQYAWSVTPAASISDAGASAPDFTFSASGTYVVTAEVSNATCATVTWRDTVVVRTAPQVDLAAIPDFCGMATFDPAPAFGNLSELDSVRWTFPGATGGDATAAYPGTLAYAAPGSYTVTVAGYNGCGTDTASRTFRVLEPIALDVALDTTLSCALPYEVRTVNRTTGDDLTFDWSVSGGGVNAYDRTAREPVLTLTDAGTYVITLEVSNPVCGTEIWRDTVAARPAPVPTLADLTEFCGDVLLTPGIDYLGMRIDSVRWTFTGSDRVPASSTGLYPTDVPYTEAGDYTYSVDIYNACGVTRLEDRFTLDTMPDIDLGPRDTVCLADGSFVLATPVPAGGTWRDAAGRPGVVTADGTFDPAAAGDGLATLEYVYTEGACVTVASREIEVMDLSYVTLTATEIDVCVTETAFPLTVGSPAGGWYTGPGVTDSTGVLDGSLLSAGDYTLSYHYREPGSPCAVSRDFTLHLRPRPQPVLEVPEILCSGDTVQLFHRGTDAVTFAWSLGDGQASTDENPVFVFQRVGLDTITLTTTSAYGCSTTVTREIEVGDAPFARFRMSTDEICAGQPVTFTDRSRAYGATAYHWDFGGGVTSDLPDPGPVSFAAGARDTTYKVTLTLTNTCGSHTFSSLLKVLRLPEVDFVATDTVGCSPFTVGFSNLTRGQADRYEWYVDGVLHATYATPPAYTFTAPADADAVYRVSLLVYNACGVDSSVQLIRVRQTAVVAAFTADPTEGCETVDVQFNNESSTGPDLTYRWDFGDGTTSTEADPSHLFPAAADDRVYTVSLIAGNGCSADTTQAPVTVYARPEIAFTTNNDVCTGRTIAFTSQSPASLTDHRWDFGDGQTLTGVEHPEHAFSAAGTYTVTLTARSVNGCLATFREDIEVRTKPEARFTLSTTEGCAPLPVRIFNQTTGADNYEWDFGDGNVFRGADPGVHVYQQPGEYTVSLRVSNAAGCTSDTIFSPVRVFGAPEAAFAFENTDACAMPQEVIFANDSRGATEYTWDFGNGQESDLEDLAVVYNESGTYEVNLTATNAAGCSTTEAMELTLYEPPVASLGFTDTVVCGPLVLPFLNQSSWSDYFDWSFSDGYTSTAGDLRRSFTTTGDYSLTLVASNAIGCADTLTMTNAITVLPVPEADFSYYEQVFDGATRLIFSDESGDDAVAYGWDFGDGNFSDVQDPTHDYEDGAEGQTVRHWVTNEYGCVDTTALPLDLEFYGGLYIPNILTPLDNTIDEQDIFLPKGLALTDYYIAIYTRTGQLVWESTELDEKGSPAEWWDGTYQGEPMMAGTYVWRIHRAEFLGGRSWPGMPNERGKKTWSGYITLLR